ncbi:hypothetical protein, partial [Candidatus Solincola tengchongensis]|uniref:hypothetical protein n=1 Tax=Candidatus Solincola tengchongensis TaxID=2900693 RepID=UPI00257BB86F
MRKTTAKGIGSPAPGAGKTEGACGKANPKGRVLAAMFLACFTVLFALQASAEPAPVELSPGGSLPPPQGVSVLHRPEDRGRRVA